MKEISLSEFRKLEGSDVSKALPFLLTYNGKPFAVIAAPGEVIVIQDMHPRVKAQFRAREAVVRKGMPSMPKVFADELES